MLISLCVLCFKTSPFCINTNYFYLISRGGQGGTVITHSPPTSEVGGSNPEPYVGKMLVSYRWLAVYSTES